MTKRQKLLNAIRSNPRNVRFEDACKAAEAAGFLRTGGKGSHCVYSRTGEMTHLNFQDRDGYIHPYQV
jgi:hypothetical protein